MLGAPLCTGDRSGTSSGIALKPLPVCLCTRWHIMSPPNKPSLVLRLAFIAGGAPSGVSHCVCPTMSITVLFDYNLDEA